MTILKYSIFFIFSFLILSIPISNNPLFFHLYKPLRPYIEVMFNEAGEKSKEKIKAGREYLLNEELLKKAGID